MNGQSWLRTSAHAGRRLRAASGFEALTAPSAGLGLLHVSSDEISTLDALVTDALMPGVDGEALVRRMREQEESATRDLAIVVATAPLDDAVREAAAGRWGRSSGREVAGA